MASQLLTDILIKKLKPVEGRQFDVFDSKLPGFALRVSPKGTKTFTLLYRAGRRARRMTVGRYPLLSLSEARARAESALREVSAGKDPGALKQAARNQYADQLFAAVAEDFIEKYAKRKTKTWRETERLIQREFLSVWKHRQIQDITKQDVNRVLDGIVARNAPIAANGALAAIRKLFNWAVERGYVVTSPCAGTQRPAKAISRERVLSDAELTAVWRAAIAAPYPFGPVVQLLILTAQRRGEVIGMRWSELDLEQGLWTIPAQRTKSNRQHQVPLPSAGVTLLEGLTRLHDELVFPARGNPNQPSSGFSKWKRALDRASNTSGWRIHDLRRSASTMMAAMGIAPHIIERILNHQQGQLGGIAGVYNRFAYLPEMRAALEKWEAELVRMTTRSRSHNFEC
jgi:integrase